MHDALRAFVMPSMSLGIGAVVLDYALYCAFLAIALLADPAWLRVLASVLAGEMIAGLFVLGHDAAHNSLTPHAGLNRVLAAVVLFPALHNVTLWRYQHNRLHHRHPNVRHRNSWSPLSPAEFRALPAWRRAVEHVYRSAAGLWLYYLIHRWWRHKFVPRPAMREALGARRYAQAWRDFARLIGGLALFLCAVVLVARQGPHPSWIEAVLLGWALPFVVWNVMMGHSVFAQHTHPVVPWFRSVEEMERRGGQEHVSVVQQLPLWWNHLTHYICEHPAHHINPRIPHYRLRAAQRTVEALMGTQTVSVRYGPAGMRDALRRCKLYDYDAHCWTDFTGRPTTAPNA